MTLVASCLSLGEELSIVLLQEASKHCDVWKGFHDPGKCFLGRDDSCTSFLSVVSSGELENPLFSLEGDLKKQ